MHLSFIAQLHAYLRTFKAPMDPAKIPRRPMSKAYERFPSIPLASSPVGISLADALQARRSFVGNELSGGVSFGDLSALFEYGCKNQEDGHRPFPSGGARYSLEMYCIAFQIECLERGVYHYNVEQNAFENLWELPDSAQSMSSFVHTSFNTEDAAALIIFSAVWERSFLKYKGLAYPLVLTEAGHAAQNMLLIATSLNVAVRPLFAFKDAELSSALRLVKGQEQVIYTIALGK